MTALLSALHRERNGATADAMRFCGRACGLNLGVVIPTIRKIAGEYPRDKAFSQYLYKQDVRELRIAALWLSEPEKTEPADFDFIAEGIVNSEIAEQAAMALLSRIDCADALVERWCCADELLCYAAFMAAARNDRKTTEVLVPSLRRALARFPDSRLVAQGAVAAAVAAYVRDPERVREFAATLDDGSAAMRYVREELAWQIG